MSIGIAPRVLEIVDVLAQGCEIDVRGVGEDPPIAAYVAVRIDLAETQTVRYPHGEERETLDLLGPVTIHLDADGAREWGAKLVAVADALEGS